MKKLLILLFILCFSIPCSGHMGVSMLGAGMGGGAAGCAGGTDGYIGQSTNDAGIASCGGTCTTNITYFSQFVVETEASQEDGSITYAHWNTANAAGGTRIGIWNTSGTLVASTTQQAASDAAQDVFDVAIDCCLAAGTYYMGIWVQGDAWAGIRVGPWASGQATRGVEMATFGNMAGDPASQGSELAANAEIFAYCNNSAER